MVLKLRLQCFFHIVLLLGVHPMQVRVGPVNESQPYLPPLIRTVMTAFQDMVHMNEQAAIADTSNILVRAAACNGIDFSQLMIDFTEVCQKANEYCCQHDGVTYTLQKEQLIKSLRATKPGTICSETWHSVLTSANIKKGDLVCKVEDLNLMTSVDQVIEQVVKDYDKQHDPERMAADIMRLGLRRTFFSRQAFWAFLAYLL